MYSLGGDVSSAASSSSASATLVSSQFISQYYRTLTTAIDSLYQFYEDDSSVVRVDDAEDNVDKKSSWITVTPQKGQLDIHNVSIPLPVSKVAIKTFDCAESGDGFLLLVHGSILLSGAERTFSQTFLLAFVDGRYYIKNEILRFHAPATVNTQSNAVASASTVSAVVQQNDASNHLNHHETNHVTSTPVKSPKPPASPVRSAVPSSPSVPSVASPNHEEKKHNRRKRHEATPTDNSLLTPEQKAEKINDGSASPASKSPKVTRGAVHSQPNESIPAVELSPEPVAEPVVEAAAPVQEEIVAPVESAPVEIPKVEEKKAAPVKAAPQKPSTWAAIFTKNTPPPTAHSSAAAAAAAPAAAPAVNSTPAAAAAPAPSSSSSTRHGGKYSAKESQKSSTLMISNVPAVAKNDDVQSFFSQFGTVSDIVVNNQGGKSATYVTFTTPSAADAVLAQKSVTLFDVALQVKRSNPPAVVESSDDGFQSSQNRRHQRAQQRHNDKAAPAPAFVPRGRGRGRGRGGFRGGRGGSNANATESS